MTKIKKINGVLVGGSGGGGSITVKEVDGSPSVTGVDTMVFPNGSVTDDGSGQVTITIQGGFTDEAKIFNWFMNIT